MGFWEYSAHFQQCPAGKPKDCDNPDCQLRIRNLTNQVKHLSEQLQELELHKDRNATVLRNQITDLKQQIKGGGPEPDGQGVNQDMKLKLQEAEMRLQQAQQQLMVQGVTGISTKINMTQCTKMHPLKQKSQHPTTQDVYCDICAKGNLLHMPFFFRCDFNCNYDICAFCYFLELTDQKQLIANIRQHSMAAKLQRQSGVAQQPGQQVPPQNKNLKDLGNGMVNSINKLFGSSKK